MNTSKNAYNVIWVDDEVDALYADTKNIFRGEGVNLIATAHTSLEFRELMDICYDRVDAVITDANFNNGKINLDIEKDLSGFMDMRTCIEKYNEKRTIPFYLYTGRIDLLERKCEYGEMEYFEKNDRIFSKGELKEMLMRMKGEIDHLNSESFRIRNKYSKELEAAQCIPENQDFLIDSLLKEETGKLDNVERDFNAIRQMVERIVAQCKKLSILPDISELNKVYDFLIHRDGDYRLNDDVNIMPAPLIRGFKYLLDITQDASHDGNSNLKLKVGAYVRETQDVNLFRSVLFIAMDLCLWFKTYRNQHPDAERNALDWSLGEGKNSHEGIVVEFDDRLFCDNYELQKPRNNEYGIGDSIRITKWINHKSPVDYKMHEQLVHVDKFVQPRFVLILKRNNKN